MAFRGANPGGLPGSRGRMRSPDLLHQTLLAPALCLPWALPSTAHSPEAPPRVVSLAGAPSF